MLSSRSSLAFSSSSSCSTASARRTAETASSVVFAMLMHGSVV